MTDLATNVRMRGAARALPWLLLLAACAAPVSLSQSPSIAATPTPVPTALPTLDPAAGIVLFAPGGLDNRNAGLFGIGPNGFGRRQLLTDPIYDVAIGPDGRLLAAGANLTIIGTDGSNPSTIRLADRALHPEFFVWSPDGQRLAFHGWKDDDPQADALYTVRADGTDMVKVVRIAPNGYTLPYGFSPDGSRIAFVAGRAVVEGQRDLGDAYVINVDGSGLQRLSSPGMTLYNEHGDGAPLAWSPSADLVAFAAFDADGEVALYTVVPDGSRPTRIASAASMQQGIAWSPDGTWIAGTANDDAGATRVFLVHPDGTGYRSWTAVDPPTCCPAWSPDSSRLIVSGMTLVDLDGNAIVQAVTDQVADYAYWWAPLP
jgi:Tol biopolymer transport system component